MQLADIDAEQFYRAVNKVQPSLIRVEADELTYNMHIILRFELEQALINRTLSVNDIPHAWNEKMKKFLGVVPSDNRQGCLQDIHWTLVGFGYFPTYALGNLYAAQIFEAACENDPEILRELEEGQTRRLLEWLRLNIHQHGRKFTAEEIIKQATGQPLNHKAFVRYVTAKFAKVYDL
jgi:carboxypeptidase Taq